MSSFVCSALAVAVMGTSASQALAQSADGMAGAGVPYRGTQAELEAMATEASGVWSDLPNANGQRRSQIQWQGQPPTLVLESDCVPSDGPVEEWTCKKMMLGVVVPAPPDNIDRYLQRNTGWLGYMAAGGVPRLFRVEHHGPDKTQAELRYELSMFNAYVDRELVTIELGNRDGW